MNEYKWYDGEMGCIQRYYKSENDPPKKKPMPPWLVSIIIALICILAFIIFIGILLGSSILASGISPFSDTFSGSLKNSINITVNAPNIDNTVLESVVNIQNSGEYGGFFGQTLSLGEGTGVIVKENGYILTSLYIVENVGDIKVKLNNGSEYTARLYAADSETNTAILKINAFGLKPIAIGDSSQVSIGDAVCVVGNSINESLSPPITGGTISGIDNNVRLQNGKTMNIFQVDSSTIANSIGGLVLNENGELIAISTSIFSTQSSEIGLATPINDLKDILSEIAASNDEKASTPALGISGTDESYGVVLTSITEGSPAEKSELKIGDLIVKADNQKVNSVKEITSIVKKHKQGDTIILTIYRDGEMKEIDVVLE